MQTINPAKTQLFCKATEAEKKTTSGILLTEVLYTPTTAEVINVGKSVTQYNQKDTIVYKRYATSEVKLNGTDYFLIHEEDVLGTVVEVEDGN